MSTRRGTAKESRRTSFEGAASGARNTAPVWEEAGPDPFQNTDVPVQTPDEVFASRAGDDSHKRFNSTWHEAKSGE